MNDTRLFRLECRLCKSTLASATTLHVKTARAFVVQHMGHLRLFGSMQIGTGKKKRILTAFLEPKVEGLEREPIPPAVQCVVDELDRLMDGVDMQPRPDLFEAGS